MKADTDRFDWWLAGGGGACARLPRAPAQADTLRSGFSVERLARVDALLDSYVNDGRIAGVVALVLRDGKPVYERAVGWADKEAGRKMTMDTEFRIASQTKALTSVAILQLMEEGKLTVNDRAGKWIPTFEKTTVRTSARTASADHRRSQAAHHHPRSAHAHRRASPTAPSPRSPRCTSRRGWARGGLRLVLRRQGRAHLRRRWNGSARCPSSRNPARE